MRILSIKLKNLNSLEGEHYINFTEPPIRDTGLFAITGDTGAGKSTILDAITLALYGKIHRNNNVTEVMTYGKTSSLAEAVFEVNGKEYMAQWSIWRAHKKVDGNMQGPVRALSQKNQLTEKYELIAEKTREVDKKVDEVIGLDFDRFSRSVLLSQGDFAAFLKADKKERSLLLERITGTEVYSEISKAAFEKKKEEDQKCKVLQQQLDSLDILAEETVVEIQEKQQNLRQELNNEQQTLEQEKKQLQQLERIQELQKNIRKTQMDMEKWQEKKRAMSDDLERLHHHNQTRPYHDKIREQKRLLASTTQLLDEITAYEAQVTAIEQKITTQKKEVEKAIQSVTQIRQANKKQAPLLERAAQLDTVIATREKALAPKQKNWKERKKEYDVIHKKLQSSAADLADTNQHQQLLNDWLEKHAIDASLVEDLPHITLPLQQSHKLAQEIQKIATEENDTQEKINKIEPSIRKNQQKIQEKEQQIDQLQATYKRLDPDDPSFSGNILYRKLGQDNETLNQKINALVQLKTINDQCKKAYQTLNELEKKRDDLITEEEYEFMSLLNLEEELQWKHQQYQYKKTTYELHQSYKNYALERSKLKAGDPCPICRSTEHPFREQHFEAQPDVAKEDLFEAEQKWEECKKAYNKKQTTLEQIATNKKELTGNDGTIQRMEQNIQELEDDIIKATISLQEDGFNLTNTAQINAKKAEWKQQVDFNKKVQQQVTELADKIKTAKDELLQITDFVKNQQFEAQQLHTELNRLTTNRKKHTQEQETLLEGLRSLLQKYQVAAQANDTDLPQRLQARKDAFLAKKQLQDENKEQLLRLSNKVEQYQNQLNELDKRLQEIQAEGEKERQEINELKQQRYELLAEGCSPKQERETAQKRLEEAEQKEKIQQQQLHELESKQKELSATLVEKQKNRKTQLKTLETLETNLRASIAEWEGDWNIDLLAQAILPNDELSRIEQAKAEMNELFTRLKQREETLEEEKEKLENKVDEDLLLTELQDSVNKRTQVVNDTQEQIGQLKERLAQNEQRKNNSQTLAANLKKQQKECHRWQQLNNLIGQQDGKKFRVFAQGLTLKRLTDLANQHLQQLNERYQIHKPIDQDLELEIIDTYQANHSRSIHTLSGGESFLVSLALALGLSDLAGRNTRIESLFIDEGFGTLDNETLEIALQTLEKLQDTGKTIGIISHIQQLKERIRTQIQVSKKGNGYSRLEIVE